MGISQGLPLLRGFPRTRREKGDSSCLCCFPFSGISGVEGDKKTCIKKKVFFGIGLAKKIPDFRIPIGSDGYERKKGKGALCFFFLFFFFFPFPLKKPKPTDGYEDPNPRLLVGRWEMEVVALGGFQQSWAQRHLRHLPAQKRWMAEPHGWPSPWPSPPRHVFSLSDSSWQVPMALCALWGKAINPGFVFQPTAIASR